MEPSIPDLKWYRSESKEHGLLPRCPFASSHLCPRYYQSRSLLGEAGCTAIDEDEDKKLKAKWERHALWPQTMEQATGIGSTEKGPCDYNHFCPEVAYDTFGYFATDLFRYADEIDREFAHKRLQEKAAPDGDPHWTWSHVTPQHYTECPLYSPLAHLAKAPGPVKKTKSKRTPAPKSYLQPIAQTFGRHRQKPGPPGAQHGQIVFISYAHADGKWLTRFERHLKPLVRGKQIDAWSDRRIQASQRWHDEIQHSLAMASAAILFVSPDFLASDYIANHELSALLKAADVQGVKIFPVIVSPCAFKEAQFEYVDAGGVKQLMSLSVFQAVNSPTRTLAEMKRPEWENTLLKLAKEVAALDSIRLETSSANNVRQSGQIPAQPSDPKPKAPQPSAMGKPLTLGDMLSVLGSGLRRAHAKADTIKCANDLKQLALEARLWANNNDGKLPTSLDVIRLRLPRQSLSCHAAKTIEYQLLSPGASERDPSVVYARCPLHDVAVLTDGSAHQLNGKKIIKYDGSWRIEASDT